MMEQQLYDMSVYEKQEIQVEEKKSKYDGNDYQIIYDEKILRKISEKCDNIEEGQEISKILFEKLAYSDNGIGLSAIQINIPKRVFVLNVSEPLYFVNPEIIEQKFPIVFPQEGCLSYPGKFIKTKRYAQIKIKADNIKGELLFGYKGDSLEDLQNNPFDERDILECIAFQHEYDHLDGIIMYDRLFRQPDYKVKKVGRNEFINIISNTGEEKIIKYKKALPLLQSGIWRIKE